MAKRPRGKASARGKAWAQSHGKSESWARGLTDADLDNLEIIEDNTDAVIEALGRGIARALEAVGIQAESDAARICPVDTGRLRNSITHTIDGDEQMAVIGTNVEYALFVHEGIHGRKGQPFLTDAVTQNSSKYRKIIEAALKNA